MDASRYVELEQYTVQDQQSVEEDQVVIRDMEDELATHWEADQPFDPTHDQFLLEPPARQLSVGIPSVLGSTPSLVNQVNLIAAYSVWAGNPALVVVPLCHTHEGMDWLVDLI